MTILIIILLVIVGIVALFLLLALVTRKDYNVERWVLINAPKQKVFEYVKQLKNQDNFNKWVMADPDMKKEYRGTDGTAGFVYAWNGNKKAGEGEQEIKAIDEGKKVATEIRFKRPFPSVAYADLITESVSENQTKVTWSNKSKMAFPMNAMVSMIENMLGKDMDTSLQMLKANLEK